MKLAILITTDKYKGHVENIIGSAKHLGYEIKCFIMDDGVNLLNDKNFVGKLKEAGSDVSLCEYSCSIRSIHEKVEGFLYASQYENASIINALTYEDRLLVF
ncbi:MAG: DsrE family protein [Deltaproteobacteria bacterium]|nr:DsrE family protein [Deltaproteobacteria bacterium]